MKKRSQLWKESAVYDTGHTSHYSIAGAIRKMEDATWTMII